jgi:hypothetical protein
MPLSVALLSTVLLAQGALASAPTSPAVRLDSVLAECPSQAEVLSALRQVLGDGESSARGWTLSYDRDLSPGGSVSDRSLLIKLVDGAGQVLAERRIPAAPGDCPALASAIAAMVERSWRTLGWSHGEPKPPSARAPNPSAPAARLPSPRLLLGAGPSMGLPSEGTDLAGANLLLQVRARVWGPLCLRLGTGILSGSDRQTVGSVGARVTGRFVTAAPLTVFTLGRFETAAGPTLRLGFDRGTSDLGGSGKRQTMAVGATVDIALHLSSRWRLGLGIEGLRSTLAGDYVVEVGGKKTLVLSPPGWRGIASVQLEFVAWR